MTRVVETISELRVRLRSWRGEGHSIGLVPTMGALHEGHLSLVRRSKTVSDRTVVSIFVNPLQFGPREDFAAYPRVLAEDVAKLEAAAVDLVFHPPAAEMYPPGFRTHVDQDDLPDHLCGLSRPGHFRGVLTVVLKLFNLVRPDAAFFGQKDFQQAAILRRMNEDLNCGVDVEILPTVREKDGLALSSRNRYLSPSERAEAPALARALALADAAFRKGERSGAALLAGVRDHLRPTSMTVDYVNVVDPFTLEDRIEVRAGDVVAAAVRLGTTRLIDNVTLGV